MLLILYSTNCVSDYPILIVISYDGFRYDFVGKRTPYLMKLRMEGTSAKYLNNIFPTKTFPNHFSIATGVYAEVHGVIGNTFYDPDQKKIIRYSYEMFHYNEDLVPIWIHNENSGKDRYSGVMMWPGGSFRYQHTYPEYSKEFDPNYNWSQRVNDVISWITHPLKPANLVMLYIEEPDSKGHAFGPNSEVISDVLKNLDDFTYYLLKRLEAVDLIDRTNLIFLSDHGLNSVSPPQFIDITEVLEPHTYDIAGSSPTLHIIPYEGQEENIYKRLKKFSKQNGHFTIYRKKDLLKRWHFQNNPRTPPIFLLAEEGYGFQDMSVLAEFQAKKYHFQITNNSKFGIHGYDNRDMKMKPFFIAVGPKIKKNYVVPPFSVTDLYSLFCQILEIKQLPNNGSLSHVQDIVVSKMSWLLLLPKIILIVGATLTTILLVVVAVIVIYYFVKQRQKITTAAALKKHFSPNNSSIESQRLLDEYS